MRTAILVTAFLVSLPARADAAEVGSLLRQAQEQFEQDHHEQALKLYKQAQDEGGGDPSVEYNMGLCHLHLDDGDKAIQCFENVASNAEAPADLRSDAFFNAGVIRIMTARQDLDDVFAPATQPSDHKPAPDAPENIEKLQDIADGLLAAIAPLRESLKLDPGEDAEHNIRAAAEAKEKKDMLDDPRAYLEALLAQQHLQVSLTRRLILNPPESPADQRQARRSILRLQSRLMERTETFANHLAQFRETAQDDQAPASQPAQKTPREQVYHAVAEQLGGVVSGQRDASAFLLDGELEPAADKQLGALDEMHKTLLAIPQEPQQALVKARTEQALLRQLVEAVKSEADWLRDPLLADLAVPEGARCEVAKTALHYRQSQLARTLEALRLQCTAIASASQPAEDSGTPAGEQPPLLDPELNRKLADALQEVEALRSECLGAIEARRKDAAAEAQQRILDMIDAALALLPKTIEEKLAELIARQSRLNAEVKAQADDTTAKPAEHGKTALEELRDWAAQLKSKLTGQSPSKVAQNARDQQTTIHADTRAVHEEIRKQIPAGDAAAAPPAGQSSQVQAYIEASKHLDNADFEMLAAAEGLDKAIIQKSLAPMKADGPVQAAQVRALEALIKALAALRPPQSQPQPDQQQQQNQQQEQQDQGADDARRVAERMDREREQAERELYQKRPRTVIKDW